MPLAKGVYIIVFWGMLFLACYSKNCEKTILPITIPKSGTNLIRKCVDLLGLREKSINNLNLQDPLERINAFISSSSSYRGYVVDGAPFGVRSINHLFFSEEIVPIVQKNFQLIFCLRDPRDRLVSGAYWVKKHASIFPSERNLSIQEVIMRLINHQSLDKIHEKPGINNSLWQYSIHGFIPWLGWFELPEALTVKFENLVGPQGGGSKINQLEEIRKIVNYLNIELTENEILLVADNLFGGTATFREGKIGTWKKHFTREHMESLKKNKVACKIIVDLGYEKDNSWLNIDRIEV